MISLIKRNHLSLRHNKFSQRSDSHPTLSQWERAKNVKKATEIKRIVVRSPNWVGDAVMSLPALSALCRLFPEAEITVAAPSGTADIFIGSNSVNNVLVQRSGNTFAALTNARQWKRARFDLAVLFQNAFAAAATALLAGVPFRVGYATDRRSALLTSPLPLPAWKDERHESFYYLNIVAELEQRIFGSLSVMQAEPVFDLPVSITRRQTAREMLQQTGGRAGQPVAILCPGSVNSRAKRWPAERYAELADRFIDAGMEVVLVGSPRETEVSNEVSARTTRKPIVLTGKTTVAEVVALISVADLLVTNDTGPAHIGAALGTPTLVIFGPTNPLTTYPRSVRAELIRQPPDCAPCMLRDCPIDHRCMTTISVDEVFRRVMSMHERQSVQLIE
jgi:heptosyltransferase-2